MEEIEKISKLFGVIHNMPINSSGIGSMNVSSIAKMADIHFDTAEKVLEFMQASQEFPYLIKLEKKKRSHLAIIIPNDGSNKPINTKINSLKSQIDELGRKIENFMEEIRKKKR